MLEVLERWNRWGSNALPSGIPRRATSDILPYLHVKEIIILTGPRRAGKSTILFQLMDALESEGVSQSAMLHLNFEEPKLIPFLTVDGLDAIYDTYRERIFPEGKVFLFLDEIQNISEWERWVRARAQTENLKIFITGSSAKLMSREIATVLTGRHLSFEIMPLDFSEFLTFQNIAQPKIPEVPSPLIRNAFSQYLQWGGFPAVVLAQTEEYKQNLLREYFDDILYKDVVLRYNVRDPVLLRNIAVHLLTQTGNLLSFQRIAQTFQVSNDLAVHYCRYLQESFVVDLMPYFSLKASLRQRHPHKVYAVDLGLRNAVSLAHSADKGHLLETLAYKSLRKRHRDNVFYWKGKQEVDFVIREGNSITEIWQVAEKLDSQETIERECMALEEASKAFPNAKTFLATLVPTAQKIPMKTVPLLQLLLGK